MKAVLISAALASTAMLWTAPVSAAALDISRYAPSYVVTGLGKEQSAVAFNYDNNTLIAINDEGVATEYNSSDGLPVPRSVSFGYYAPASFYEKDTEALTYIGNNKYVLGDERTMTIAIVEGVPTTLSGGRIRYDFKINSPDDVYSLTGGVNIGNEGLEGITFDPLTGGFFGAKQTGEVYFIDPKGGPLSGATSSVLFNASTLGLSSLNDIQALSIAPDFAGRDFGSNLLLLSATDKKLLEVTRQGSLVSTLDLDIFPPRVFINDISPTQIEGVTIDFAGNIYLVSELGGTNRGTIVRFQAPAVPEPATWAMLVIGFGAIGGTMRRRRAAIRLA